MTSIEITTSSKVPFVDGMPVELCGLVKAPHLNRRIGIVAGGVLDSGRFPVVLLGESNQMAFKVENLKVVDKPYHASCSYCCKTFAGLTVCGNCHMESYCSPDCQERHWHQEHKGLCKMFKQGRKSKHDDSKLPTDELERVRVRLSKATHYSDKGKWAKAEKEYRAVMQEPGFDECGRTSLNFQANLAQSMILQEVPQKQVEAIAILREVLALTDVEAGDEDEDNFVRANYLLGSSLREQGMDLDEAARAMKKAQDLDSGNSPYSAGIRINLQEIQEKMARASKNKKKHRRNNKKYRK